VTSGLLINVRAGLGILAFADLGATYQSGLSARSGGHEPDSS
jgi:hypothetical protein